MTTLEINICYNAYFFEVLNVKIKDEFIISIDKLNLNELILGLIVKHKIPEFAIENFKTYIYELVDDVYHDVMSSLIKSTSAKITDAEQYVESIKSHYQETWSDYQSPGAQSDFEIFGNAYLRLVESGTDGMEAISRLELQFSRAMTEKIAHRDVVLSNLDEKYMSSMRELEESSGMNKASEINKFEQQYHKNRLQMEINWNSDISALREEQRRDFREFIMNAYSTLLLGSPNSTADVISQDSVQDKTSPEISVKEINKIVTSGDGSKRNNIRRSKSSMTILTKLSEFNIRRPHVVEGHVRPSRQSQPQVKMLKDVSTEHLPWQESFTIHLGRQMRSTHNMRIYSVDPLDLLAFSSFDNGSKNKIDIESEEIASRLSTALNLYSRNLTAIVLLVDNRLNTYSGMKNKFASLCERSTDFHFAQLDQQLEEIKRTISIAFQKSTTKSPKSTESLDIGDVYVTCHSNLNLVEVVFHLVVDESTIQKEIRFPSSIHNAIRNILRACFLHDIFCLNIPLLLSHTLKEYMTSSWCIKRVETILKAVKGAMMELCTWRGRESRTIQFLVPPGLSDEMLTSFSALLTDYFQLSKVVKK